MVGANPLIKIGAGIMIGAVVVVGISKFTGSKQQAESTLQAEQGEGDKTVTIPRQQTRLGAEADTPETSVEALAKAVSDVKNQLTQLEANNSGKGGIKPPNKQENQQVLELQSEIEKLRQELSEKSKSPPIEPASPSEPLVEAYPDRPAANERDFGLASDERPTGNSKATIDLPTVPNLFDPNRGKRNTSSSMPSSSEIGDDGIEWIMPSDGQKVLDERTGKENVTFPKFKGERFQNPQVRNSANVSTGLPNVRDKRDSLVPIYTIPENASFLGSVGATALIGRVPLNNQVTDPFPFKVVVGQKNLATNGINIPNLQGMVVSGLARGDYTLKCLSGQINSITYTFVDGTIRTVSDKKGGNGGLGYLTDSQGVPCITGKYITNLPSYLGQTMGINAVAGMAEAFANGQAEITKNTDGSSSSIVNGGSDSMKYMAGKGIGAGVQSGANALAERQQGAYDAVYVPPGTKVEIHLTSQIDIDYDKKGRKVSHVQTTNRYSSNRSLD